MNEILIPNARLYARQRQLDVAEPLGSGKDGIVMVAQRKAQPAEVAIKVFRWPLWNGRSFWTSLGPILMCAPDFPEEIWADWEADKREKFEGRWPTVQKILEAFEELGIYLLDVSPGNIAFLD